jgi:hypothetical protein
MTVLVYPDSLRSALTLTTTTSLAIGVAFSTFLGVMVATHGGCTPSTVHGLAMAFLVFLGLTTLFQAARLVSSHIFPGIYPASEKNLSAKALKITRWVVLGTGGMAFTFATALSTLAFLERCSSHERHALAFTTLLFLGTTLVSGGVSFFLRRPSKDKTASIV